MLRGGLGFHDLPGIAFQPGPGTFQTPSDLPHLGLPSREDARPSGGFRPTHPPTWGNGGRTAPAKGEAIPPQEQAEDYAGELVVLTMVLDHTENARMWSPSPEKTLHWLGHKLCKLFLTPIFLQDM